MTEVCSDCGGPMRRFVKALINSIGPLGPSIKSQLPLDLKKYDFADFWICERCGHVGIHLRIFKEEK